MPPKPSQIRFLDLARQYQSIKAEIDEAIARVIADSAFIGGPHVQRFEEEFAAFQGARHCVGVGNGTDAIEIALEALELPQGSEVLVQANSFIASSEAITRAGHRVVFCDCDPRTYMLSLEDAERRITPRTRAIMPVHLYGHPADMDAAAEFARAHGLRVLEDAAQAHGAECRGRRVGGLGDVATFSFYPGKNLGAYGDAGAVLTNDEALARRVRMIANHGRVKKYDHQFEGRNSRMDGIQGAVLSVKLRHLEAWLEHRRAVAARYDERLAGVPGLVLPVQEEWARHVYHLYVIRVEERDELQRRLNETGVATGIHYPIALTKLAAYAHFGLANADLVANRIDAQLLSLPIGEHLSMGDVDRVADCLRTAVQDRQGIPGGR